MLVGVIYGVLLVMAIHNLFIFQLGVARYRLSLLHPLYRWFLNSPGLSVNDAGIIADSP